MKNHGLVGGGTCGQCRPSCVWGLLHMYIYIYIYIYINKISHLVRRRICEGSGPESCRRFVRFSCHQTMRLPRHDICNDFIHHWFFIGFLATYTGLAVWWHKMKESDDHKFTMQLWPCFHFIVEQPFESALYDNVVRRDVVEIGAAFCVLSFALGN